MIVKSATGDVDLSKPGTAHERIDALAREVATLKRIVAVLLTGQTLCAEERDAFLAEVDP